MWSHLPNANHIDAVFVSLSLNEHIWKIHGKTSMSALTYPVSKSAYRAVSAEARKETSHEIVNSVLDEIRKHKVDYGAGTAALGVIHSLIAYNDCSHLLNDNPEEVLLLAKLGNNVAICMYSASLVFNTAPYSAPVRKSYKYISNPCDHIETETEKKLADFLSKL